MVERKLSGVYTRREVEIPYAWFEKFVSNMVEHLANHALDVDEATLANDPRVIAEFDVAVEESIKAYYGEPDDSIGDPWSLADNLYAKEIEQKKQEQMELMRQAMVVAKKDDYMDKAIPVRPPNRARAIQILKDAGLFDDLYANYMTPKLKEAYGKDNEEK